MSDKEKQKQFLKANSQSYSMEILMQQNAALEREIERLMAELDEATMGIQMKGYLHKWRDREISFASKWGLRYFVLQKNTISYYVDDTSNRPRRTIPLEHCIVKDEGLKRGGQCHVFSIYSLLLADALGAETDADLDNGGGRKTIKSMDESVGTATLVLRLSCSNLGEARLWIDMLHQACSMASSSTEDEDTHSAMPHHISFPMLPHVKSLAMEPGSNPINYQASSTNLTVDASIETWENSVNVESMDARDDHHQHPPNNHNFYEQEDISILSPLVLQRVKSSTEILKKSMSRPSLSLHAKNNGSGSMSPITPSDHNLFSTHHHQHQLPSKSAIKTAATAAATVSSHQPSKAKSKTKAKSGYVPRSFPASKPMHVKCHSSPLSSEVRSHEISYRGFFNLGIIIFILTHFRLILDNTVKYGFLQEVPWTTVLPILGITVDGSSSIWDPPQVLASIASWLVTILTSYGIEKVAAQGDLDETVIMVVNYIVGSLNLLVPCFWVWTSKSHPLPCMIYLFQSVVIWMKLISYAHVNRDLRVTNQLQRSAAKLHTASSTNSISTPVNLSRSNSKSSNDLQQKKSTLLNLFAEMEDLEAPFLVYPQNISIMNLLYFCLAPTLCYQLNYPRSKSIKMKIILSILFRLGFCSSLILVVIEQYVRPILENAVMDMKEANIMGIIFRLLKLSIPSTYVWLLSFYIYFHLWLNLLAEITRFGDREFYRDWWNSRTIDGYWRLWNLPVHHWMLRHLCK
jgi:hypothetical protein